MATVIYGPMATGKTYHRQRFQQHYDCRRTVEADFEPEASTGGNVLILTNMGKEAARRRYPNARLVSIEDARRAIGLEPAPPEGFRPPYDAQPGWQG